MKGLRGDEGLEQSAAARLIKVAEEADSHQNLADEEPLLLSEDICGCQVVFLWPAAATFRLLPCISSAQDVDGIEYVSVVIIGCKLVRM